MVGGNGGEATDGASGLSTPAATPLRYEMDPQGQFNALQGDRGCRRRAAGIYHSHTKSAAYPSQTDVNQAVAWPEQIYVIVSLADRRSPTSRPTYSKT